MMIPNNYIDQVSGSIQAMRDEQKGQKGGTVARGRLNSILKDVGKWADEGNNLDAIMKKMQGSKSYKKLDKGLQDRVMQAVSLGQAKAKRPPPPTHKPQKPERSPRAESERPQKRQWRRASPSERPPSMEAPEAPERKN